MTPGPVTTMHEPGPAGQIADGAGGIGRGLLVAHADIGKAGLLRCLGERTDREPDHAEHELHALFLEAFRQQVGAFDLSHVSSCHRATAIGPGYEKIRTAATLRFFGAAATAVPEVASWGVAGDVTTPRRRHRRHRDAHADRRVTRRREDPEFRTYGSAISGAADALAPVFADSNRSRFDGLERGAETLSRPLAISYRIWKE